MIGWYSFFLTCTVSNLVHNLYVLQTLLLFLVAYNFKQKGNMSTYVETKELLNFTQRLLAFPAMFLL